MPEAAAHAGTMGSSTGQPSNPDDLNRRAITHIARDEIPDALELVDRALAIDSVHQPSMRTRIHILNRIGMTAQAAVESRQPEALDLGPVYAGFWQRFGARFLDLVFGSLLAVIPSLIVGAVLYLVIVPEDPTQAEEEDAATIAGYAVYTVWGIVNFLYVWIGNAQGGTWGKRAFGLRVISVHDGRYLGYARSFLRYLISLLGAGVLYIGWLWMIWDKNKQTWHDKVSGSIVVKSKV